MKQQTDTSPKSAGERRTEPRYRVRFSEVAISTTRLYPIINVSVSGVLFSSQHAFEKGVRISLTLNNMLCVDTVVLECSLEMKNTTLMETHYRVRCRFEDEETGERLLNLMECLSA